MANRIDLGDLVYNLGFSSEAEFVAKLDQLFKTAESKAAKSGQEAGKEFVEGLEQTNAKKAGEELGEEAKQGILAGIGKLTLGSFLGNALSNAFSGAVQIVQNFVEGSVQEFTRYDAALVTLRQQGVTNLDAVNESLTKLSDSSKVFSETELAGALGALVQGGLDAAQAMRVLEAGTTLASGSLDPLTGQFAEVTQTSIGLSDTMRALGLDFEDTSRVADVLSLAAQKSGTNIEGMVGAVANLGGIANTIGIPVEELAASIATLTNVGYSAQESSNGLNTVIAALISPTGTLKKQADELGLSFVKADGSTRSLNEVMRNVGLQAEKGGNGLKLLKEVGIDTYGLKVAAALGQATDKTQRLSGELQNATGSAEKFAAVAGNSVAADVKKMEAEIKNAQKALGQELIPILKIFYTEIAPALLKVLGALTQGFADWLAGVKLIKDAFNDGNKASAQNELRQLEDELARVREQIRRLRQGRANALATGNVTTESPEILGMNAELRELTRNLIATEARIKAVKAELRSLNGTNDPNAPIPKPPATPKPPAALPPAPSGNISSSSTGNPAAQLAAQTEAQRKFNKALEDAVKAYESGKTAALDAFVVEQKRIYNLALAAANAAKGEAAQEAAKKALALAASNLEKAESALDRERTERARRIKQREEDAARDAKKNEEDRKKAIEDAKKAQQELEAAIKRVNDIAADQSGKDAAEKFTAAIKNIIDTRLQDLRVAVEAEEQAARAALAVAVRAANSARAIKDVETRNAALAAALSDATTATNNISAAQGRYNQVLAEQETRLQAVFDKQLENAKGDEAALAALVASSTKAVEEAKKQLASSKNIKEATEAYKNAVERLTIAEKALATVQREARQAQLDLSAARRADARERDIDNASLDQLRAAQSDAKARLDAAIAARDKAIAAGKPLSKEESERIATELANARADLGRIEQEIRDRLATLREADARAGAEQSLQNEQAAEAIATNAEDLQSILDSIRDTDYSALDEAGRDVLKSLVTSIEARIKAFEKAALELREAGERAAEEVNRANNEDLTNSLEASETQANKIENQADRLTSLETLASEITNDVLNSVDESQRIRLEALLERVKARIAELKELLAIFEKPNELTDTPNPNGLSTTKPDINLPEPDSKPDELNNVGNIEAKRLEDLQAQLKGEFTGLGRSFVDSIIEGIRSGDMSKAFESILGNASSYFLNKVIDGILGDVASSLASAVAKSATANTAAGAAGSAGALGALGPAGLIIGGVALLGSLFLGAANQGPKIPNAARDSSLGRDGNSPAISYTVNQENNFGINGSLSDPMVRAELKVMVDDWLLTGIARLGLIDPAKANGGKS
jgi:TP901 family phage tail tape measure protein